jgi:hypothetical protein
MCLLNHVNPDNPVNGVKPTFGLGRAASFFTGFTRLSGLHDRYLSAVEFTK